MTIVNIGGDPDDAVRRDEACLVGISPRGELQYGIRPKDVPIDGILIREHALSVWLTITTGSSLFSPSSALKSRPATMGTPSAAKYPGEIVRDAARGVLFAAGMNVTISRRRSLNSYPRYSIGVTPTILRKTFVK